MPQPTHTRRSLTVFTALAPTIGAGMALVIALPALAQETVTRNQRLLLSPASVAASGRETAEEAEGASAAASRRRPSARIASLRLTRDAAALTSTRSALFPLSFLASAVTQTRTSCPTDR